ncbi:uncharacterized protein ASPGLDRAFT_62570 [Aspergillus glaucus CBS 516.65]|uniref:Fumarylacetoacetase n=1 Tax=Aspergillus glaucus CBS 516.65 TaxID=1160497 RepID=A0A1L9VYI0_ASPGL|nr:hypothetical protein ASPGLDRAFT_62570 [Aspergillus glaucus CBS 516.65]OJJ88955.1 hypothetical protein ASPGLDRAFT_62570 [Aspergillus glaucus CBS 516.65]
MLNSVEEGSPFTVDNIPFGVISTPDNPKPRCATAFGNYAIDLSALERVGFLSDIPGLEGKGGIEMIGNVFSQPTLNAFAAMPKEIRLKVRNSLTRYFHGGLPPSYYIPLDTVTYHYPMDTSNFSDFFCSLEHVKNCAKVMNAPITPSFFSIPQVYNGRTSSLKITNTPIHRPRGVIQPIPNNPPIYAPTQALDFELEMGVFISKPLPASQILNIRNARDHIFGFVVLNDWSARDIQGFEMVPLGPFHGKGSGTSVSPWVVTCEALDSVACAVEVGQEAGVLPHLRWKGREGEATFDVKLQARVLRNGKLYNVTSTNLNELYWTPYQQLTHLASAGEGLSTGDIFGTGTITSDRTNFKGEKDGIACLVERKAPENELSELKANGIEFLQDGDEVVMEGWCVNSRMGVKFGFGECRGKVLPSIYYEEDHR